MQKKKKKLEELLEEWCEAELQQGWVVGDNYLEEWCEVELQQGWVV